MRFNINETSEAEETANHVTLLRLFFSLSPNDNVFAGNKDNNQVSCTSLPLMLTLLASSDIGKLRLGEEERGYLVYLPSS